MSRRIVVIGAGFGGIAAAVRLAARGHQVTLIDKRDKPGGRAYVYEQDGFTFDGGPTVITAPWLIEELFELAGRRAEDSISMVPVDPFYRIFFPDRASFDYTGDPAEMERRILALTNDASDVEGYREFLALSEKIFAKGFTELADKPFLSPADMLRIAPDLIKLQSYRTVYGLVSRHVQNDRLRQILSFHPLLVGGNPFQTTSIYALIHHLERHWGVWFAMGGTGAVVDALIDLFRELGGTLELDTEVSGITANGRTVSGVQCRDGRHFPAEIVVCNAEVGMAWQTLLPDHVRPSLHSRRLPKLKYSMSLVVIYFGTNRTYRDDPSNTLAHHNIILGPRYEGLLSDIFAKKVLAEDFSLYLHMPTITDPSLSPEGGEAFYVLAPVPHLGGTTDWARAAKPYRDRIIQFLEENYLPDLGRHIVSEHMIDPRHFRDDLNSYLGSAFSVEPVLTQSAWFRPHNRADELDNLYLVGAGTHPGAGLPGVLSSARIADDLIAADHD